MRTRRAILWFRNDLRLHDNEALHEALDAADEILPVYVFDDRKMTGKTAHGFRKCGKFRARFIIESVADLKENLKDRYGIELVIRRGLPEREIFDIARQIRSNWVFCNRERTVEEVEVQDALEKQLWTIGQEMRYSRGKMLYYTADLPFPVTHTPDIFSNFRREVEQIVQVRKPLPLPERLPAVDEEVHSQALPGLEDFDHPPFIKDERSVLDFRGGESAGLERMRYWIREKKAVRTYKETRNELIGADYSSKFSAWLAQGCLSPKTIYWEVKQFEERQGANKSTYWLIFELLWRDFFRFMVKKHGSKLFRTKGIASNKPEDWKQDRDLFRAWAEGRTGMPFVDANMKELNATGYMSNRGRQNVASFLAHDLKVDWVMGAEYFESLLVDYDPCSNYGNWAYIAGVGNDPRPERRFNVVSQARTYDPQGAYIHRWLPALSGLSGDFLYNPSEAPDYILEEAGVKLGKDYPLPVFESPVY